MGDNPHIDIVFDGPPGPDGGRLVEIDDAAGRSISLRTWIKRPDGCWTLRITSADIANAEPQPARKARTARPRRAR